MKKITIKARKKYNDKSTRKCENTIYHSELKLDPFIKEIKSLVGVTQSDFKDLYITTIKNFIEFQNKTIENSLDLEFEVVKSLKLAIHSLKKRQGYLLPVGADSERIFREQEIWSFAVFSAALFIDLPINVRLEVPQKLIPEKAYYWLERNEILFECFKNYLSIETKDSIFREFIHYQDNETKDPEFFNSGRKSLALEISKEIGLPESEVRLLTDLKRSNFNEHQQPIDNIKKPLLKINAESFWSWVKNIIHNEIFLLNQTDFGIYCVELGLLIAIPTAINKFFSIALSNENKIPLKSRIKLTNALKKAPFLIRNVDGSRIHIYYQQIPERHKVITGLLICTSSLNIDTTLPIDTSLTIDFLH